MSMFEPTEAPSDSAHREHLEERLRSGFDAAEVIADLQSRGLTAESADGLVRELAPDIARDLATRGQASAIKWSLPFLAGVAAIVVTLSIEAFPRIYLIYVAAALYGGYRTVNGLADLFNGRRLLRWLASKAP